MQMAAGWRIIPPLPISLTNYVSPTVQDCTPISLLWQKFIKVMTPQSLEPISDSKLDKNRACLEPLCLRTDVASLVKTLDPKYHSALPWWQYVLLSESYNRHKFLSSKTHIRSPSEAKKQEQQLRKTRLLCSCPIDLLSLMFPGWL